MERNVKSRFDIDLHLCPIWQSVYFAKNMARQHEVLMCGNWIEICNAIFSFRKDREGDIGVTLAWLRDLPRRTKTFYKRRHKPVIRKVSAE